MKATVEFVEEKIVEFNELIFAGRLPKVPVRITASASALGSCVHKSMPRPDGTSRHFGFELRVSARVDLSERELEDVIIHEMIHYFILYNGLRDTSPHGVIFKSLMQTINASYHRNITISHSYTPEQKEQVCGDRRSMRVIAAIWFRSGKAGVKVLPRVERTILDYCRAVKRLPDVERVDLYMSDNPYFGRYPRSGALRIYQISPEDLKTNLRGARPLSLKF